MHSLCSFFNGGSIAFRSSPRSRHLLLIYFFPEQLDKPLQCVGEGAEQIEYLSGGVGCNTLYIRRVASGLLNEHVSCVEHVPSVTRGY